MFEQAPPSAGEVRALANQLLAWADSLARPKHAEALSEDSREEQLIALATASLEARRLRGQAFPELPLNEPVPASVTVRGSVEGMFGMFSPEKLRLMLTSAELSAAVAVRDCCRMVQSA